MNNSTVFFSHLDEITHVSYPFKATLSVAIGFVALLSAIGNILVIVSFLQTNNLRSAANYYITSMAVSDLLYVGTDSALFASSRLSIFGGFASPFQCKLGMYLTNLSYSVSIVNLVLITVDRFIATVFPMKMTMMTGRIREVLILLSWTIPMVILSPYLYYSRSSQEIDGPFICADDAPGRLLNTIYPILGVVFLYLIPLIAIIILNTRIMKSLRRTNPAIAGNGFSGIRRRKQNQRIMEALITINVIFFTCWTPYYLWIILLGFFKVLKRDKQEILVIICLYFLPIVSTAANPVILFTFSTNYRQALNNCLRLAVVKCRSCFSRFTLH